MGTIVNTINETGFEAVTVKKLAEHPNYEIVLITLEKGEKIPPHSARRDAQLILLEGQIKFYIDDRIHHLLPHHVLCFGKEIQHSVEALADSKFVLVK